MVFDKSGMLFVLSSPSGAGKTTLTKLLAKKNLNFTISISYTTRQPRVNEKNGKDYCFVDRTKFEDLINNNCFFEYASIFGNYYGTHKENVLKHVYSGKDVLFDIDWQGAKQLKQKATDFKLVTFFILPPNVETLKKRLVNRDQDGKQLAAERMKKFKDEVSHWKEYDYVLINENLDLCYQQIYSIIESEKSGKKYEYDKEKIKKVAEKLIN